MSDKKVMKSLQVVGQDSESAKAPVATELGVTRRQFLKILGSASAVGAVSGCAESPAQKIFPNLRGGDEQIPGIAVWYNSTCSECSAGCGIQVRTREGRAIKIEGNRNSPINRGGLCALGQSSLQALYDPDRIREPQIKSGADPFSGKPTFKPISWADAYAKIAGALKNGRPKAFITAEVTGSLDDLLNEWSTSFKVERTSYEPLAPTAVAKAAALVYGVDGVPELAFDKAEVILNFGADFLETWGSPCGYARDWAKAKKSEKGLKFIHVEPRLSLTGANADLWISIAPGTELAMAKAVLKELVRGGGGKNLSDDIRDGIEKLTRDVSLEKVSAETGVTVEKILSVAHYLANSSSSLVLAGGAAAATSNAVSLMVTVNLINLALGNVGTTVNLDSTRKPKTSMAKVVSLIDSMKKGAVDTLFIHGTNPAFSLPSSYGFEYALKSCQMVVAFASHLDETARLADIILPTHHSLESWGDSMPLPGVYGMIQPVMTPIFNTRSFGDVLLGLSKEATGKDMAPDFHTYLKGKWEKLHNTLHVADSFNKFWVEAVERGGYFDDSVGHQKVKVKFNPESFKVVSLESSLSAGVAGNVAPVLLPYPSIKAFDGRAANRPWMQEIPDPIVLAVWDAWAEIHPRTATKLGLASGDTVTVRNDQGEINVPVYITEYVHPDVIAVPMGQGHDVYGRYASQVGGGNVMSLLPAKYSAEGDSLSLLATRVKAIRSNIDVKLVKVQDFNSQMGRGLARTAVTSAAATAALEEANANGESEAAEEHEGPIKQMYQQRVHPLYRWGMAVDLAACTGCAACVVACYAENNIPTVGKKVQYQGREMAWLRIERYYDGSAEELQVNFLPMMCQHCGNAPCEPVCPVYAAYHNEDGLNTMLYNRCVGTRYCSNNCSYKVRRFNWFEFDFPEPLNWQLNPDVTKRGVGVMEKCTFCIQRITEAKDRAKDLGRLVKDGEVQPACVQSCPTEAMTFGNLNDPNSKVSKLAKDERAYKVLDKHINTQPAVSYLEDMKYKI